MKKIVFAIQIFGLIVTLPIYVISELDHTPAKVNRPVPESALTVKPGTRVIGISTETTDNYDLFPVFTIN